MARLDDVAMDSGFSRATVSRVINNESLVKPETVRKIKESMERLGYKPNMAARALSSGRSNSVAVFVPDHITHYYADLLKGITDVSQGAWYHTIVKSLSAVELTGDLVNQNRVDGIIIRHSRSSIKLSGFLEAVLEKKLPVVFIGAPPEGFHAPSVRVDNSGGAREMGRYFSDNNYRNILFISGQKDNIDSNDRREGFQRGLEEGGFDLKRLKEVEGDFSKESGYRLAAEYLGKAGFDAVYAANDRTALGVLHFLNEHGISVPEEISLAGFDDAFFADYLWPPLTTVRQPMYEIGKSAMTFLLQIIGGDTSVPYETILPAELVVRSSCRKIESNSFTELP